ncbi:MAG TPA: family 16 glycoside hydrolase [Planctomycetota bacterium]|nr:family 16 glycoside hydrolase [Planctomycetota bacterium]
MSGSRVTRHASRVLVVAVALLAAVTGLAADKPFEPGTDGWLTLFDGSDLARWKPDKASDWALKDQLLVGSKGSVSNYWYWQDFELAATVRGTGSLRFRVSDIIQHEQAGYALDLADGTVRTADGRAVVKASATKSAEWRDVRLVVTKGRFSVSLNGKAAAEGTDEKCPEKGFLALDAGGEGLALKLLCVRPLGREKPPNIPTADSSCFVCHANFDGEKIAEKHAADKASKLAREEDDEHLRPAKDRPKKAGCAGCHGPSFDHRSDEDNVTTPDIMFTRGEVKAACLQCHTPHKTETKRRDGDGSPPPNPVCTDCHGHHKCKN